MNGGRKVRGRWRGGGGGGGGGGVWVIALLVSLPCPASRKWRQAG